MVIRKGSRSLPVLIFLLPVLLFLAGCAGAGAGSGGWNVTYIPAASAPSKPGGPPSYLTLAPTGYTMENEITTGTYVRTVPNFGTATNEVMLIAVYHPGSVEKSGTGYTGSFGGSVTGLIAEGAGLLPPEVLSGVLPPAKYDGNEDHMFPKDMKRIEESRKECFKLYGGYQTQSIEKLQALGKLDANGLPMKYVLGDTKEWFVGDANQPSSSRVKETFVLRGQTQRCRVWVRQDVAFPNADPLAWEFHNTILPIASSYIADYGTNTSPWRQGVLNVIMSPTVNENAYFDPYDFDGRNAKSNNDECVYMDPRLGFDHGTHDTNLSGNLALIDWRAILAHEYQHFLRECRKFYQSQADSNDGRDSALNEGLSQYTEVLVGNGFTNSPTQVMSGLRINSLVPYLNAPQNTSFSGATSSYYYSSGLMMVLYLANHFGSSITSMEDADALLGPECMAKGAGMSFDLLVDKVAMAMRFSAYPGMQDEYRYNSVDAYQRPSIDLSGATTYDGVALHPAYYASPSTGHATGINVTGPTNVAFALSQKEYAPIYLRAYNGNNATLTLTIGGIGVTGSGYIRFYFLKKT